MKSERMEMLEGLLKSGVSPVLLEDFPASIFTDAVVLDSNCSKEDLNGHYEGISFCPPEWYEKLESLSEPILVISNINKIPVDEQKKFVEILKYKKVSTFDLPEKTIILVTANNLENNKISEDVYSLVAHI